TPPRSRPGPSGGRRRPRRPAPPGISRRESSNRIRILAIGTVALLGAMGLRAGYLGVVKGEDLQAIASSQQVHTVDMPAIRGSILDRTSAELAVDRLTARVEAAPYLIADPVATAAQLAPLLRRPPAEIAADLDRTKSYVILARRVDHSTAERIRALKINGVDVIDTSTRYLPQRWVAAQLVGLVGDEGAGLSGLELGYDEVLTGRPGSRTEARDPFQHTLRTLRSVRPEPGRAVLLTLDSDIQRATEEELARVVRTSEARGAMAVVMRPRDGAILAMASVPRFDPNDRSDYDPERARNGPVAATFEPGSTFKIVPVAAALEAGEVTPDTVIDVPPVLQVEDLELHDAHEHGHERWSVTEIVERSSNIGTVRVAQDLGRARMQEWITRFGFGAPTGVDIPGEESGLVLPVEKWSGTSIANIPIGQGVAVTQVQLARAYAAIANGGMLVTPHVVQRVGDEPATPAPARRIMRPQTARQLDGMLRRVVSPDGTAPAAVIPGYTVAGKTGTAQKIEEDGTYSDSRYLVSFVGYFPADRPELVIAVAVDEPRVGSSGGEVAAPAFRTIGLFSATTLRIAPDG
ncbi:MAG TPA: penicillin-binding protein 2, partial [Miltoncostaeaceae bacterium]|nr:penicillin-binding protein 2 [Miltoncostaeaceae bacterium]